MGIFGFGDDKEKQVATPVLQQAQDEPTGLAKVTVGLVTPILDIGIDGKGPLSSAQSVADSALKRAGGDPERAIDQIVRTHLAVAAAGGFLTGMGGFVTMPVALPANVLEFYLVATRMTAAIAAVRGHDLTRPNIRSAVLLALVGADADDVLRKAGVAHGGGGLTDLVAERLPGPALMVVNKAVAFRLVGKVGSGMFARLGRGLPVAGGAISGSLDSYLLKRIATHARSEFPTASPGITSS